LDNRVSDPNKNYVNSPNYRNPPNWERNPEITKRYQQERIVPSYGDLYGEAPLSVCLFFNFFWRNL